MFVKMEIPIVIPQRKKISHKNDYGKFLVWATSAGIVGCGYFVARAIYLTGGGYVRLMIPRENYLALSMLTPESIFLIYNNFKEKGNILRKELLNSDYLICGPGIGICKENENLIKYILHNYTKPIVFDADAIKLLQGLKDDLKVSNKKIILTPHEGEFSYLTGISIDRVKKERKKLAIEFAEEYNIICILKGYDSIITDGRQVYVNKSGGPQLAKAGTGDVLTGIIGGLLGLGLKLFEAASVGVYIHGVASEIVKKDFGEHSLIPEYLLNAIPSAIKKIGNILSLSPYTKLKAQKSVVN